MEVHGYNDGAKTYRLIDGYPQLVGDYLNQTTIPTKVTVCAPDFESNELVLFDYDMVYIYTMTGDFSGELSSADASYTFLEQFNLNNGATSSR